MSEEKQAKILIVEDELDLLELIVWSVQRIGHLPFPVASGEDALKILEEEQIDMVLLDVMLPGITGPEVCKAIRAHSDIPIVVISALGGTETVVEMLELGADEYITKPFSFSAVEAQIMAQLRRLPLMSDSKNKPVMNSAELKLDTKRQVVQVENQRIQLSDRESSTLQHLIKNAGSPVSSHDLCMAVWGEKARKKETTLVQTTIQRLRAKIEENPGSPKYILTVRGYGYKVNAVGHDR